MEELIVKNNIIKWNEEIENELMGWSNNCKIYKYLHIESHSFFKRGYHTFIIPVIVLSTLTGSANLSINTLLSSESDKTYASVGIGLLNLLTGILSTLMNFFKFSERKEAHRNSEINFTKLYRAIDSQLALPVNERSDAKEFYNYIVKEYNKLLEVSPTIRKNIINNFKSNNKMLLNSKDIELPDIIRLSDNIYKTDRHFSLKNINNEIKEIQHENNEIIIQTSENVDNEIIQENQCKENIINEII